MGSLSAHCDPRNIIRTSLAFGCHLAPPMPSQCLSAYWQCHGPSQGSSHEAPHRARRGAWLCARQRDGNACSLAATRSGQRARILLWRQCSAECGVWSAMPGAQMRPRSLHKPISAPESGTEQRAPTPSEADSPHASCVEAARLLAVLQKIREGDARAQSVSARYMPYLSYLT